MFILMMIDLVEIIFVFELLKSFPCKSLDILTFVDSRFIPIKTFHSCQFAKKFCIFLKFSKITRGFLIVSFLCYFDDYKIDKFRLKFIIF